MAEQNNDDGNEQRIAQTNRISVKVLPFYRANPTVWFLQLESQFVLAGITTDVTKFHYTAANLPEDVALSFISENTNQSYEQLKNNVIALYQKSKSELIEEALGNDELIFHLHM